MASFTSQNYGNVYPIPQKTNKQTNKQQQQQKLIEMKTLSKTKQNENNKETIDYSICSISHCRTAYDSVSS